MEHLKIEDFERLVKLFKINAQDYELWNDCLSDFDSRLISRVVTTWIKYRNTTPKIADLVLLAKDYQNNDYYTKEINKTEERKRIIQEAKQAKKKDYYLVFEKNYYNVPIYSWYHKDSLNCYFQGIKLIDNNGEQVIVFKKIK